MSNNESPRNDGLTKEFIGTFWEDLKKPLCASRSSCKTYRKKDRDKKLIKNQRPILLLNINTKLISKGLAERMKNVLPFLIPSYETAHVKVRFIREGGRLKSDVLQICDKLQIKGLLMTVDI